MTQVICKLNDSGSQPLTGFVRVIADYIITDNATGVATLPVPKDTPLVNGQCTLNLEDSDLARVSYRFEVWQTLTDGTQGIVWTFNAKVPASITPINLTDLVATGITRDALDTGLLSVSRRILASDIFWSRLKTEALNFKGVYSANSYYRRGDCVVWNGSSYIKMADTIAQDILPSDSSVWLLFAAKGEVATAVQGDNAPYGAAWANDLNAPSKNTLRNVLETLAPKNGAVLQNAASGNNLADTDYTNAFAYTKWVVDKLNSYRSLALQDATTQILSYGYDTATSVNSKVATNLTTAKNYTDAQDAVLNTNLRNYAVTQDNSILSQANAYADNKAPLNNPVLPQTLTVNGWTNLAGGGQTANPSTSSNSLEIATTTWVRTRDQEIVNSANSYTDTRYNQAVQAVTDRSTRLQTNYTQIITNNFTVAANTWVDLLSITFNVPGATNTGVLAIASFYVANRAAGLADFSIRFIVNGVNTGRQVVTLASNEAETLTLCHLFSAFSPAGNYTIKLQGQSSVASNWDTEPLSDRLQVIHFY